MKRGVPPRGAVFNGRPMMMAFDVDCGELIPGHHFIARGLGGPFRLPIPDDWDGDSAEHEQMLEFEEAAATRDSRWSTSSCLASPPRPGKPLPLPRARLLRRGR